MRKNDARKLDHATLEQIRMRAVAQVHAGESPEVVAKALGINRTTIYDWLANIGLEDGMLCERSRYLGGPPD